MASYSDVITTVQSGDVDAIRKLLADDPELASAEDANGVSALMLAFYFRRAEIADLLLAAKPELDIFEATAAGKADRVFEILRQNSQSARQWSADGFTALHFAAFFNGPEIARILIEHGADVSAAAKNKMKVTPLHSAAAAPSCKIVRILVENGADANARQEGGWTALHEAAQIGDMEMVKALLDHGADAHAKSDDGKTPAEMAKAKGHEQMRRLLSDSA